MNTCVTQLPFFIHSVSIPQGMVQPTAGGSSPVNLTPLDSVKLTTLTITVVDDPYFWSIPKGRDLSYLCVLNQSPLLSP